MFAVGAGGSEPVEMETRAAFLNVLVSGAVAEVWSVLDAVGGAGVEAVEGAAAGAGDELA